MRSQQAEVSTFRFPIAEFQCSDLPIDQITKGFPVRERATKHPNGSTRNGLFCYYGLSGDDDTAIDARSDLVVFSSKTARIANAVPHSRAGGSRSVSTRQAFTADPTLRHAAIELFYWQRMQELHPDQWKTFCPSPEVDTVPVPAYSPWEETPQEITSEDSTCPVLADFDLTPSPRESFTKGLTMVDRRARSLESIPSNVQQSSSKLSDESSMRRSYDSVTEVYICRPEEDEADLVSDSRVALDPMPQEEEEYVGGEPPIILLPSFTRNQREQESFANSKAHQNCFRICVAPAPPASTDEEDQGSRPSRLSRCSSLRSAVSSDEAEAVRLQPTISNFSQPLYFKQTEVRRQSHSGEKAAAPIQSIEEEVTVPFDLSHLHMFSKSYDMLAPEEVAQRQQRQTRGTAVKSQDPIPETDESNKIETSANQDDSRRDDEDPEASSVDEDMTQQLRGKGIRRRFTVAEGDTLDRGKITPYGDDDDSKLPGSNSRCPSSHMLMSDYDQEPTLSVVGYLPLARKGITRLSTLESLRAMTSLSRFQPGVMTAAIVKGPKGITLMRNFKVSLRNFSIETNEVVLDHDHPPIICLSRSNRSKEYLIPDVNMCDWSFNSLQRFGTLLQGEDLARLHADAEGFSIVMLEIQNHSVPLALAFHTLEDKLDFVELISIMAKKCRANDDVRYVFDNPFYDPQSTGSAYASHVKHM